MVLSAYSPLASRPPQTASRRIIARWHPSTSRSLLARSNALPASAPPKRRRRRRLGRPPRPRHKPDERPWSRQSRQRRQVRPASRRRLRASRRTAGTAEGRRTGALTSTPTSTSCRPATGSPALARVTPVAITAHLGRVALSPSPVLDVTRRPQVEGRPVLQRRPVLVSAARSCVYPVLAPIAPLAHSRDSSRPLHRRFRHGAQDTATEAPSFVLMMHVEEGLSKPPLIRKGAATRSDPAYSECHLCVGPASNDCAPEGAPSECANVRTTVPLASAAVGSGESKSTDSPASPRSPVTVMELSLEPPQFQPDRGLVLDAAPLAFPLEPLRATPCAWAWGGSPYFVFQPSPPPTSSPPQDLPWPWQWFSGGAKAAPPIWELPLVSSMSIPFSLLVTPTDGASAC